MTRYVSWAIAALALALGGSQANAGFVPVYISSGSDQYNYELQFSTASSATLTAGDFITLYDLASNQTAFSIGGADAGSFTVTKQLLGVTPAGVNVTDSATLYNVTFAYNGPTLNTPTTFQITITYPGATVVTGLYSARDQLPAGANEQRGPVMIPVPEPTSLTLMGLGGVAAALFVRRRARTA